MDKQPVKCAVSRINVLDPYKYHEFTIEILRRANFIGTYEKITEEYWKAYVYTYNRLIEKFEEEKNK